MRLLRRPVSLLLAVPMRIFDLSGVHGSEFLGHVMQRDHLAMPGLRGVERIRQSVAAFREKYGSRRETLS
jgi:hypothetical protein